MKLIIILLTAVISFTLGLPMSSLNIRQTKRDEDQDYYGQAEQGNSMG